MRKSLELVFIMAGLVLSTQARAALIGNDVGVGRASAGDGATTVFQVYPNAPIPGVGTIDAYAIFDQAGNTNSGHAYVLRPTGGNNYLVVNDTSFTGTGTNATRLIPVAPIVVQANDLIAHYGRGVPYTDGTLGGSFQQIYYSSPNAPVLGNTITLGSAAFPHSATDPNFGGTFVRDYAFAANFVAAPEPSSLSMLGLGAIGLVARRRRR